MKRRIPRVTFLLALAVLAIGTILADTGNYAAQSWKITNTDGVGMTDIENTTWQAPLIYALTHIANNSDANATVYFKWGNGPWKWRVIERGQEAWFSYPYSGQSQSSPDLFVRIDVDTNGVKFVEHVLSRGASPDDHSPRFGHHFTIKQLPGTDTRYIEAVTSNATVRVTDKNSSKPNVGSSTPIATSVPTYYTLQTRLLEAEDKCLEGNGGLANDSVLKGAAFMNDCTRPATGQIWKLVPAGNGYYTLQTKLLEAENKCLEGNGGLSNDSVLKGAAFMNDCSRPSTGQRWKLVRAP